MRKKGRVTCNNVDLFWPVLFYLWLHFNMLSYMWSGVFCSGKKAFLLRGLLLVPSVKDTFLRDVNSLLHFFKTQNSWISQTLIYTVPLSSKKFSYQIPRYIYVDILNEKTMYSSVKKIKYASSCFENAYREREHSMCSVKVKKEPKCKARNTIFSPLHIWKGLFLANLPGLQAACSRARNGCISRNSFFICFLKNKNKCSTKIMQIEPSSFLA